MALLTRYPVLDHAALRYPGAEQFCQRVRVDLGGRVIDVYSMHLNPYSADRRRSQVMSILRQMRAHTGATGTVLGGDLNATPEGDEICSLRPSLRSAHVTAHGREPAGTRPTPFRRGSATPDRTVDYLWHSATLSVLDCQMNFSQMNSSQPDPHDPLLFAAGHVGLAADCCLTNDGERPDRPEPLSDRCQRPVPITPQRVEKGR